jgi:hypothetical protein
MLVSKRRRLLDYLKTHDTDRYRDVIGKLGIRKYQKANIDPEAPRPDYWSRPPFYPEPGAMVYLANSTRCQGLRTAIG